MKLAQISVKQDETFGLIDGNKFYAPGEAFKKQYGCLGAIIQCGAVNALVQEIKKSGIKYSLGELVFRSPLSKNNKIICVGINYPKLFEETPTKKPENIIVFSKFHEAIVAHNSDLEIPIGKASSTFDFEVELGVIIGERCFHTKREEAMSRIFGYTIFNDGSVRDWQKHSLLAGKNFYRSSSCGPWITTADEIDNAGNLSLQTVLNGSVIQTASTREMYFAISEIIEYISYILPLYPGDMIATGSPGKVLNTKKQQSFLKDGDVIEFSVSNIGTLKNTIKKSVKI